MTDRTQIIKQIYEAIDEVNLQLPADQRVAKTAQTVLLGAAGALDSLAFLNLIVATEEKINSSLGVAIPLASRLMESERDQLPHTIDEMADLILHCLKEEGNE